MPCGEPSRLGRPGLSTSGSGPAPIRSVWRDEEDGRSASVNAVWMTSTLATALVLLVSGIAKLRSPDDVDRAFAQLPVPALLDHPWLRRGFPWAEIVLALALLLLSDTWWLVAGAVTSVLFLVYLALVGVAVARGEEVYCGCFGSLFADRVTRRTVARNIVLLMVAVVSWATGVDAVREGAWVRQATAQSPSVASVLAAGAPSATR